MIDEPSWPMPDEASERDCAHCGKPIFEGKEILCACPKYGIVEHEGKAWCSEDCLWHDHPDDYDLEDVANAT